MSTQLTFKIMRSLSLTKAIIILLSYAQFVHLVLGDIGTASSYGPPYTPTRCGGNRLGQFPEGNLFAAVSGGLWDNGAACGRRYRLRCISGTNNPCKGGYVDVRVVDLCSAASCPSTFIMSNDAFTTLSRRLRARINVEFVQI